MLTRISYQGTRYVLLILPSLVAAVLALSIWQLWVDRSGLSATILPTPRACFQALWLYRELFTEHAWVTFQEVALGYILAMLIGIALGTLLHSARVIERALYPWFVLSQAIPTVAVAPLFVLWTDFGLRPKILVVILTSFFPIVVNTIDGLRSVDPRYRALLRSMGASRWRILRIAEFPAALPSIFSGMKIAATLAPIGAIFGEWTGASSGLGYLILTFNNQTRMPEVFAAISILALMSIGLFLCIMLAERLLLPWYFFQRRSSDQKSDRR